MTHLEVANRSTLNLIGRYEKKEEKEKKNQNTEATVVIGKAVGLNMTAEESWHMVMSREGNAGRNQNCKRQLINWVRTWQSSYISRTWQSSYISEQA